MAANHRRMAVTNDREGPDAEGTMGIDADVPQPVAPPRETIRSRSVNDFDSEEGLAMGGNWTLNFEETPPDVAIAYDGPNALLGFRCFCEIIAGN